MSPAQSPALPSDAHLIVAAMAAGDERALGALYDAYGTVAYGLAFAITGAHAAAEKAVATAFADAWRGAGAFDATRGGVLAWLTTLVRRAALGSTSPRDRARPGAAGIGSVLSAEPSTPVTQALRTLTEPQRRVLELSYFRGLSIRDIAAQLGEPESGARELLRAAMNELRSALSPNDIFEDHGVTRA
jgi:RNA polymerase sigma-70 factor (ECF subfamily)